MKRTFMVGVLVVLMLMLVAGAAFAQDDSMDKPTDESMVEVTEEPMGEVTEEPMGEVTEEPTGEVTGEPMGEVMEEPMGRPMDEPMDGGMSGGTQRMERQPVAYKDERNQFAFSVGPYYPARDDDDPSDDDWETGGDLTATYTRLITNRLAIETGLHAYATTFDKRHVEGERSTAGVEVMALYVPIHTRLMPYIGGGLGFYSNHLKVKVNGTKVVDDDGSAAGIVLKGGIRAHMTQRFFIGGFVKGWTNNQKVKFENGHEETLNYGGASINFEVGVAF